MLCLKPRNCSGFTLIELMIVVAIIGVLVVIQSLWLFACITLRGRVRLIAADAFDVTAVYAADLNLKAAIEAAQDASRRNPLTGRLG